MTELLYSTFGFTVMPRPGQRDGTYTREDYRRAESSMSSSRAKRDPRRSQTHHNYQLPSPPPYTVATARAPHPMRRETLSPANDTLILLPLRRELMVQRPPGLRPPINTPRRSYSAMDEEPVPQIHRLSDCITLLDMPPELHFALFDFLDPIDSTCLGLTNKHFYSIYRRMHGTIPLSARRSGPNELEWAWHLAGNITTKPLSPPPSPGFSPEYAMKTASLTSMDATQASDGQISFAPRVRGQAFCRKCGVTRCELHKHIKEWAGGEHLEYCSVSQKFGHPAPEDAKLYCYMSRPGDKTRCGRHHRRRNKVSLQ